MKENNILLIKVIVISIICFFCLSISVAFSYVYKTKAGEMITITTGSLGLKVDNMVKQTGDIEKRTDEVAYEMFSDNSSLGSISFSNVGDYDTFYTINVSYGDKYSYVEDMIPMEYVKIWLVNIHDTAQTIGNLPVSSFDVNNVKNAKYALDYGMLHKNESKTIYFAVWIDSNIPKQYTNKYLDLFISIEAKESSAVKQIQEFTGHVACPAEDGTLVTDNLNEYNIKLSLNNYTYENDLSLDNNFSFDNLHEGLNTLKLNCNEKEYQTNILVKYDSVVFNEENPPEGIVLEDLLTFENYRPTTAINNNVSLQEAAYTYFNSPGLIKKYNHMTTSTNEKSASPYQMPSIIILDAVFNGSEYIVANDVGIYPQVLLNNDGLTIANYGGLTVESQ